ncbi:centrosome-associated protein 350-like [Melanaphis sacchari]|uniref:centrosome-associated protein 350-like n=1 Tax=Melanaphis sacchari TaxID=742174 RepID=UPI000DC14C82|nr:centrosome-associated protein 350-like [Melanaphis sacchari]
MIHVSEAIIMGDTCKQISRPHLPTVKDTVQILSKPIKKPSIPTVNETILLNEQSTLSKNTKSIETKLFIEKKKKERTEKYKSDLLEKKKLAEERKKKLDQLQKTTKELAKASVKQKMDQTKSPPPSKVKSLKKPSECLKNEQKNLIKDFKITDEYNNNTKDVDQTWLPPPPKAKYRKKPSEAFRNVQKKSIKDFKITDECSNDTKDVINACTSSKKASNISTTELIEQKPQKREVTKPENLFSNLKFNDDYQLFDISMSKLIDTNTSFVQKDNNDVTFSNESCHDNEKQSGDNAYLDKETLTMADINMSTKPSDIVNNSTKLHTGLQLPIKSHEEIMKSIDHLEELQELLFDQCLPVKKCNSESTQTKSHDKILSILTSKSPPPPLNFISVLKCKLNLQQPENNNLKFYEPAVDLNINECTNENNLDSTKFNKQDVYVYDEETNLPNINHIEPKNCLDSYKPSLIDEPIKPKSNNSFLIEMSKNNNHEEKVNAINNDKLFTKLNIITNEDIKQVLKKLNYDFDLLTKNNCSNYSNNLHNTSISLKLNENNTNNRLSNTFPEIHDEFQAELNTLDQLNNSLCDIERMSCDTSIKTNEQSIELNDDTNFNDNDIPTPFSKLNALSSNMMGVDKTITGFSIQMFEQLMKDEKLRAKQHHTILNLREKSLTNRLKWEVTMYDLQVKNFKNRPGYEKQFQLFKQKQRGTVKKLEHSLSQVKRLGRVIDSVYKQRFIMLEEHIQHLRNQSSSKKVMRKLKSLDQFPKKEEHGCRSINSHIFKQFDKSDFFDSIDSEHDIINPDESKNNTFPTKFKMDKSIIILRNQATSPISVETNTLNQVQNVEVQTDVKYSSQSIIDKAIQTSKTKCNYTNNVNIQSFNPVDLSYKTEVFDANKTKDKRSLSPILPTSPVKLKHLSETSNSTNSEQSDLDTRIITLQEQLEAKKLESSRLKKEQKKLRLENLKAKEQDLLKQINLYDKKIEESRKSLIVEIKKKNLHESKSSIINHSFLTNSNFSVLQNIINYENDYDQHMNESDKITWTDGKKYFYPTATDTACDQNISLNKPVNELQKKNVNKSKENYNMYKNNFDSVNIDSCKPTEQSFQSLESNAVCEDIQLHRKHTEKEINDSKKCHEIEIDGNILLKPQLPNTLNIQASNNLKLNLKEETHPCKITDNDINLDTPLCRHSFSNQIISEISNNQEPCLKTDDNKSLITHDNINCSNTASPSDRSVNQSKLLVNLMKNDTNVCEKQENSISQFEVPNYKIGLDDIYSSDFTSDDYTSNFQGSYQFNKNDNIIELNDSEQSNETSYEEERSEGEIIFEDKTFIEQYSDDHNDFVQMKNSTDDKVHAITNNIFNCLLKDTKKSLNSNMNKSLFRSEIKDLNNLTEETPLLLILKREEENQNRIILSEQATVISNVLFKQHFQPLLAETLQMYLPRLNEIEMEKLKVYLKWSSSKRKKLKLSECLNFKHKFNDVDNEKSFELFYQNYLEQKKSQTLQDESNNVMLSHTQQEAEKLKQEQIRIEEEIERLRMSEETQFFLREIPNKPPPPYKSPTKIKSILDIPYTSDEVHKIVLTAANQLFNGSQNSLSNDFIIDSDSVLPADYQTLIFDYCKEIALDLFIDEINLPLWKRSIKRLKNFRARPKNPKDLSDIVIKKMNQIIDIDECEEKVNKFVVKQMHEEDSKWTDFQMDELEIQNNIVQSLMKKLVCDTIANTRTNFYLKFI